MGETMDKHLRNVLSGDRTPKFLATLDGDGVPNCVPVISIVPWDETTVIFGEFLMNKTRRNLHENAPVGIAVMNDAFEGWSLKGTFLGFETSGEHIEHINRLAMFRYNAYTSVRAAGIIRIGSVVNHPVLGRAEVLRDYLRASLIAKFMRSNGEKEFSCMPGRVQEKFERLGAVRAVAYRDSGGFPNALPMIACMPAGPNRLIADASLFRQYTQEMPPGTPLAAAIITKDPVAYQVKGIYAGRRTGVDIIDLKECYSASPPLLGDRIDAGRNAG
jgi:hypothetical protein